MLEKKKGYIDQLLGDLRSLEERVSAVKNNDSLPFSFFKESFDKIQKISKTLHLLEFMQIDDMRGQMERLVYVVSTSHSAEEKISTGDKEEVTAEEPGKINADPAREEWAGTGSQYTRGVILPEYRNPKPAGKVPTALLSDITPMHPSVVDLKRNLSLNDRFLFQRELFRNNRQEMDRTMEALGTFKTYEEAEEYLRKSLSWDFEDSTVNDFLLVIKQGFE